MILSIVNYGEMYLKELCFAKSTYYLIHGASRTLQRPHKTQAFAKQKMHIWQNATFPNGSATAIGLGLPNPAGKAIIKAGRP